MSWRWCFGHLKCILTCTCGTVWVKWCWWVGHVNSLRGKEIKKTDLSQNEARNAFLEENGPRSKRVAPGVKRKPTWSQKHLFFWDNGPRFVQKGLLRGWRGKKEEKEASMKPESSFFEKSFVKKGLFRGWKGKKEEKEARWKPSFLTKIDIVLFKKGCSGGEKERKKRKKLAWSQKRPFCKKASLVLFKKGCSGGEARNALFVRKRASFCSKRAVPGVKRKERRERS